MSLNTFWKRRANARFKKQKPKGRFHAMVVEEGDIVSEVFGNPMCTLNGGQGPTGRQLLDAKRIFVESDMCDECKSDLAEMIEVFPDVQKKLVHGTQQKHLDTMEEALQRKMGLL